MIKLTTPLNIDLKMVDTFVGRAADFIELDNAWPKHCIFGVFGLRSVGKSRFVSELLKRQGQHNSSVYSDLRTLTNLESVFANMSATLNLGHGSTHFEDMPDTKLDERSIFRGLNHTINTERDELQRQYRCIVFDNAEDLVESQDGGTFLQFCTKIIRHVRNVKIIITSTTCAGFAEVGRVFCLHELKPLVTSDACALLKQVAPGIDFGDTLREIAEFSEGLPLLIQMIGAELLADNGLLEPREMLELLSTTRLKTLSGEHYPPEDRIGLLSEIFRCIVTDCSSVRAVVVGYSST